MKGGTGMNSVAPLNRSDFTLPCSLREPWNNPGTSEPGDSASLSDAVSWTEPASLIKSTFGVAMGLAEAAIGTIPSTTGGITSALSVRQPQGSYPASRGEADPGYILGSLAQGGLGGGVAGGVTFGPWGAIVGTAGGLILSGIKLGIDFSSGVDERVFKTIEDATFEPILDNAPTGDPMYDAGKNVSEGGILGMKAGAAENFRIGREKADGTLSGLWEGAKGFGRTLASHSQEPPQPSTPPEQLKKAVASLVKAPFGALKCAAGVAGGVAGSALVLPDGMLEGMVQGASHHGDQSNVHVQEETHRAVLRIETTLLGLAAGSVAGPLGAFGGAILGGTGGLILTHIEKITGTDKQIVEHMEGHLKREMADNGDLGSKLANEHRNVVEGTLVGTAAGLKEGFSAGYDAGTGFVQGVYDGFIGVGKGIKGAIKALKNTQPQNPAPEAPDTSRTGGN